MVPSAKVSVDAKGGGRVVAILARRQDALPLDADRTGELVARPHWAMSRWWVPQSVSLPPEYSNHQRNVPWQRLSI